MIINTPWQHRPAALQTRLAPASAPAAPVPTLAVPSSSPVPAEAPAAARAAAAAASGVTPAAAAPIFGPVPAPAPSAAVPVTGPASAATSPACPSCCACACRLYGARACAGCQGRPSAHRGSRLLWPHARCVLYSLPLLAQERVAFIVRCPMLLQAGGVGASGPFPVQPQAALRTLDPRAPHPG